MNRAMKRVSLLLAVLLLAALPLTALATTVNNPTGGYATTAISGNTYGTIRNPNGGSFVNVRSWPNYDADILTTLPVGMSVELTGSTGTWYAVWVNGVVGYIHSNFVNIQGSNPGGGTGTGQNATVRSGPLNVREAASMRARIITQLPTGLRVTVIDSDGTWSRVLAAQVDGWVVSSYLTMDGGITPPTPDPPVTTEGANATIRTTNGGTLNLREWASSSAPILGSYANGSRVRVLTQGALWCRVQVVNAVGYMSTQYLRLDSGSSGGGTTTNANAVVENPGAGQVLNLRASPTTTSKALGQYQNNTPVRILGAGTDWHRVSVNGQTGYMMAKYVRITDSSVTPHKTVTGGAGGYVNLRSGPGYDYGVTQRVNNGTAASVVIPYATWSEVLVRTTGSNYIRGYMLNSFLK